ncbi:MAG: NAD(P)-binding domain-containing protein [Thermoleophilia bacterium]|nr:NAD(P)-binding domain-containing protein [Thermoleophilia bacterium]
MTSVGVIGAGNMGSAMVRGWARDPASNLEVVVWDKVESAVRQFDAFPRVRLAAGLEDVIKDVDFVFLVVKPKDAIQVLRELRSCLNAVQTVVSAMAGVTLAWLREGLGPGPGLIRIMPNLAVEFGVGTIGLAPEWGTSEEMIAACRRILSPLGLVEMVPEDCMDAVTAVAGSGPAFFAIAMEALEDGAVSAGLSRAAARALVLRVAARVGEELMLLHDEMREGLSGIDDREQQMSAVARAAALVEQRAVREAFRQAVVAAVERGRAMLLHQPRPSAVD